MDWVAAYGAALSTFLAAIAGWNWWQREIYLTVHGIHPSDNAFKKDHNFSVAITNSGRRPTVVHCVKIDFLTHKSNRSESIGAAQFDSASSWDPSQKMEPIEGKPNTSRRVPNVLQVGDELHGQFSPIKDYLPAIHWIKITASARNSKRGFVGWIAPMERTS